MTDRQKSNDQMSRVEIKERRFLPYLGGGRSVKEIVSLATTTFISGTKLELLKRILKKCG
jgi:hypothetical protein